MRFERFDCLFHKLALTDFSELVEDFFIWHGDVLDLDHFFDDFHHAHALGVEVLEVVLEDLKEFCDGERGGLSEDEFLFWGFGVGLRGGSRDGVGAEGGEELDDVEGEFAEEVEGFEAGFDEFDGVVADVKYIEISQLFELFWDS